MKKYSLTSTHFEGEVIFEFTDDGTLAHYDSRGANLTAKQLSWISQSMPHHLAHIKNLIVKSKSAKITEIKEEITFDRFWNRYNYKDRSSKKRALQKWNRMSLTERKKAYDFIGRYEMTLKAGIDRKYAETYLNAELWNN